MDMGTLEGPCHPQCGLACGGHPPCGFGSKIRGSDLLWKRKGKDLAGLVGSPPSPAPAASPFPPPRPPPPSKSSGKASAVTSRLSAGKATARPLVASPGGERPAPVFTSINRKEQGHTERIFKCRFWVTMATGETVKPKVQLSCSLFHINLGRKRASFPPFRTPVSWGVCFQGFKQQFPCSCHGESP